MRILSYRTSGATMVAATLCGVDIVISIDARGQFDLNDMPRLMPI